MSRHRLTIRDSEGKALPVTPPTGVEQKSSGLIIATGTGSTSWFKSASRYLFPEGASFPRTSRYARFALTEPSDATIQADGSRGVPPLVHGVLHEGERLEIGSLNKGKGVVSVDSIVTKECPAGSTVTVEIDSEPAWTRCSKLFWIEAIDRTALLMD